MPVANSESTSASLLARARQLDIDAWNKIVELYGPMVYNWARKAGLQDADSADVAQETFASVASNILRFRRENASDTFRGWLFTIARNKIRDHFRQAQKTPVWVSMNDTNEPELPAPDTEFLSDADEVARLKQRALRLIQDRFAPDTWEAFWRVAILGESPQAVAEAIDMPVMSVYQSKSRIMRQFRRELKDLIDF